jgi:copper chaperone CopZ
VVALLALGSLAAASLAACKDKKQSAGPTRTLVLHLGGMTCGGCVQTLTNAFKQVPGAKKVTVTLHPQRATIQYDASRAKPEDFVQAAKKAGYQASLTPMPRPAVRRRSAEGPARR